MPDSAAAVQFVCQTCGKVAPRLYTTLGPDGKPIHVCLACEREAAKAHGWNSKSYQHAWSK